MPRSLQAAQMLRPAERGILTSRCFVDPIWPHADPRARPPQGSPHAKVFATRFFRRSMRAFSNIYAYCSRLASSSRKRPHGLLLVALRIDRLLRVDALRSS